MWFHVTGSISAAIFLLTIAGLVAQLRLVARRRRQFESGESSDLPTDVLSINQFVSSFLAFFAFFLYGLCLEPLNHYLIWPRLAAALLTLNVMVQIWRDRRDRTTTTALIGGAVLLVGGPLLLQFYPGAMHWFRTASQSLIVLATIVLGQGYLHQVLVIRRTGQTGGVSARLHQFFLWKDISSIAFAFAMGLADGWPVLLLSTVSGITKIVTLWHFRWVRLRK